MKFLTLLVSILLSSWTHANTDARSLLEFKLASVQLSASFSAFLYFQGDKRNILRLHSARRNGDEALEKITSSSEVLTKRWKNIVYYLEKNSGHQFDDSDISLAVSWSLLQRELNEELDKLISNSNEASSSYTITDNATEILTLQLKMENILSQYMTFANATTGSYGSIRNEIPFEQQIENITVDMNTLSQGKEQYDSLKRNWKYIKKTLLAYNSNIAPYIVLHTFDKMRVDISEVLTITADELIAVE